MIFIQPKELVAGLKAAGLTQSDVARYVGLTAGQVSRIANGIAKSMDAKSYTALYTLWTELVKEKREIKVDDRSN